MKITFLKTRRGTYIFTIKEWGTYLINGTIKIVADGINRDFEISVIPETVVKEYFEKVITLYTSKDGVTTISPDFYQMELKQLLMKARNSDGFGDYTFDNIDDEYAYKKFLDSWIPTRINKQIFEDIPFELGGVVYSDYKEIVPLIHCGGEIDDPTCNMLISPIKILKEVCLELDIVYGGESKTSDANIKYYMTNSSHSEIYYAQLNGKYIFTDDKTDLYKTQQKFRGSYEECVEKLKKYKADVKKVITDAIYVNENKHLSQLERVNLINNLKAMHKTLSEVAPMQKSTHAHRNICLKLFQLIQSLNEGSL